MTKHIINGCPLCMLSGSILSDLLFHLCEERDQDFLLMGSLKGGIKECAIVKEIAFVQSDMKIVHYTNRIKRGKVS